MMKKGMILAVFGLLAVALSGQGIEFFHGTFDEAKAKASESNQLIFVDAYTTWCGPCKRMAAQVFPTKEVGDFFNANFVNMKLDMERGEGLKFRQNYPVQAFPTFFWIDGDGQVVHKAKGARQPADFVALGESAVKKYDSSVKWKVQYDAGDKSYEVVYNYIKELNNSKKSSLKVTNAYLKTQDNLQSDENLRLILEGATEVDSKPFEYLIENKKKIVALEGEEAVNAKIETAAKATAQKGAKYESLSLVDASVDAMKTHLPELAGKFETDQYMNYAVATRDADLYYGQCKTYVKKYADDNAWRLSKVSTTVLRNFVSHPDLRELAEQAAEKALEIKPTDDRIITYATLVLIGGDKDRAMEILNSAIKEAREQNTSARKLQAVKRKFESA